MTSQQAEQKSTQDDQTQLPQQQSLENVKSHPLPVDKIENNAEKTFKEGQGDNSHTES